MVIYIAIAAILAALVGSAVKNNVMIRTKLSGMTKKVSVVAVALVCMFATACGTSDNEKSNDTPEQNIEDTTKEDETEQETPEENVEEEKNKEEEASNEEEQKQEEITKNEKETKVKEETTKETPKKEEPKKEAPKKEEPKQEAPKKEEPKKEVPKQEAPKQEVPKQEAPKKEEPKQEAPKQEEPAPAPPAPEVKSKYKNGTFSGTADGFQGPITVNVTINNDQITGISVASHSEDDPFWSDGKKVIDSIISAQSTSVNAVSGATFSSNGIKQAVSAALNSAKN